MNGACAAAATLVTILSRLHVLGAAAELVVADQHAVGLAAELAVLFLVDLLEQLALVELDGLLEVLEQLLLLDVQDADLEVLARLALIDEIVQAAPGRFQLLEVGVVHDLVELGGQLLVDLADPELDVGLDVLGDDLARLDHAFEELLEVVLGAVGFSLSFCGRVAGRT